MLSVIPLMAFNLKDMDLLHIVSLKNWMTCIIQKKYPTESDSHPLLLGRDFDWYSPSLSSWDDHYLHTLDDMIGAKDLSGSSFLSTYSPNVISLPWSHSANYNDLDFGKQVEIKKDINADYNYFPLA